MGRFRISTKKSEDMCATLIMTLSPASDFDSLLQEHPSEEGAPDPAVVHTTASRLSDLLTSSTAALVSFRSAGIPSSAEKPLRSSATQYRQCSTSNGSSLPRRRLPAAPPPL